MEDKHEELEEKSISVKDGDQPAAFHVPPVVVKVVVTLNLILAIFILADFFLTPVQESAELWVYKDNKYSTLYYPGGNYDDITLDQNFRETIGKTSDVSVSYTPVFNIRKYFEGTGVNGSPYREDVYDLMRPVIAILLNVFAFWFLVARPRIAGGFAEEPGDVSAVPNIAVGLNFTDRESALTAIAFIAPVLFSLVYWSKLYTFIFG